MVNFSERGQMATPVEHLESIVRVDPRKKILCTASFIRGLSAREARAEGEDSSSLVFGNPGKLSGCVGPTFAS